jgi:hypothetical protein
MIRTLHQPSRAIELSSVLLQQINQRTNARIEGLRVEVSDGNFVVVGQAPTFHVKQLALAACHQVLSESSIGQLICDIEVCS